MQAQETNIDVENVGNAVFEKEEAQHNYTSTSFFLEAAALLTVWSVLVINEGAIRLIDTNPAIGLNRVGDPPPVVLFIGGLFEVIFGMIGLALGVAGFIFKWYSTNMTKLALVIQQLFGYYVFIVFVFLPQGYRASNLEEPLFDGELSLGQSKFFIALGILTTFHFCLALQGGQFVYFVRLICGGTGNDFLRQRTGNGMRAIFWNMNLAFSGLWTLITGALIHANVGGGHLATTFESPPNVGRLPSMTIWTGLLVLLYGLSGAGIAVMKMKVPVFYYLIGGYVYITMYLNFTIVQFGTLPGAPGGPIAVHGGLVFMIVFLGPYFVRLAQMENEGKEA